MEFEAGLTSSRWFYDPLGTWPSFVGRMPWMDSWFDVVVETQGIPRDPRNIPEVVSVRSSDLTRGTFYS